MLIKFIARSMPSYKGTDGMGKVIALSKGETAEVSESTGKLLCQKYSQNFEEVKVISPSELPSKSDKKQRKVASFKAK